MSLVLSHLSSRSPHALSHRNYISAIESFLSIVTGLCVRFVIDAVTNYDHKITGSLVGMWEGVMMQHFFRKVPSSYDPYVSYGVRLFVDFLITQSLTRLTLVLIWTGMGVVLADIAPAIWIDAGLRHFWRRFLRDLHIVESSFPRLIISSKSPIVDSTMSRAPSTSAGASTVFNEAPRNKMRSLRDAIPILRKRPVPGAFQDSTTETETDLRTPVSQPSTYGTSHFTFSLFPGRRTDTRTISELTSSADLDGGNLSTTNSSLRYSVGTSVTNPAEIPDEEDIYAKHDARKGKGKGLALEDFMEKLTPLKYPTPLPPISSLADGQDPGEQEVAPPTTEVPNIPDTDEMWENVRRAEEKVQAPPRASGKLSDSTPPQPVPPPEQKVSKISSRQEASKKHSAPRNLAERSKMSSQKAVPAAQHSSSKKSDVDLLPPSTGAHVPGPPSRLPVLVRYGAFDLPEDTRPPPPSYLEGQAPRNVLADSSNALSIDDEGKRRRKQPQEIEPVAVSPDPIIEPLQSVNLGRMDQVLELRRRATNLDNQISMLKVQQRIDVGTDLRVQIGKLSKELERLNKKADVWYESVYNNGSSLIPTEIDLSNAPGESISKQLKHALTLCLLKNKTSLEVIFGTKKKGIKQSTQQKEVAIDVLQKLQLEFHSTGKGILVQLPSTPARLSSLS